jgi:NADH dehydrogenase (ubiquinone) Fe-S protein 1
MARAEGGKLAKVDWQDALTVASAAIAEAGENIAVVVGPFADVDTMCLAKDLANKAGSEMVTTEQSFIANGDLRSDYTFNSTIAGIEEADRVIIIGK